MEKNIKRMYIYICITELLCCTTENNIVNQLYFNKKVSNRNKNSYNLNKAIFEVILST